MALGQVSPIGRNPCPAKVDHITRMPANRTGARRPSCFVGSQPLPFGHHKAANQGRENPRDLAFLAMVLFQLKRTKDAEAYFQRLKVAMKNEVFAKDKDFLAFFAEADQLLHAK